MSDPAPPARRGARNARRRTTRRPSTPAAGALALALALAVAACGGATGDRRIPRPGSSVDLSGAPGPGAAPRSSAMAGAASDAPLASADAPSTAPGAAGCTPGLWATIKDHVNDPAVALVGLVDGCRAATIETTLDASAGPVGVAICEKAAEIAYPAGVASITVLGADTRPLAAGTAGSACSRRP